jgi:branched-chain amino acid transport system permease protein
MTGYLVSIGVQICIYLLLTLGLNLHYGFTGLINFGQVAFYCIGAYVSALVAGSGAGVAAGIAAGTIVAAIAALPIGAVTLRLRTEYLAIVTLGFAEAVHLVAVNEIWLTNGSAGLSGIERPFTGFATPLVGEAVYLGLLVGVNLLAINLIRHLVASPFGRLMQAVRDREDAVRALGKAPPLVKLKVLMVGAGLGGLAGALQAHYIGYVSPDQFVGDVTFLCWMAMIIGGTGRISGSIVGAVLLLGFVEGTRFLHDFVPVVSGVQIAHLRLAVVGFALILFLLYRPEGLVGRQA